MKPLLRRTIETNWSCGIFILFCFINTGKFESFQPFSTFLQTKKCFYKRISPIQTPDLPPPNPKPGQELIWSKSQNRVTSINIEKIANRLFADIVDTRFRWIRLILSHVSYPRVEILVQKTVWRSSLSRGELASKILFWTRILLPIWTKIADSTCYLERN